MQGFLIYVTGLSGAGKSTLIGQIIKDLQRKYNIKAIALDGDILRECVGSVDYSQNGRLKMAMYYVRTAKMLCEQGFVVVLGTISMFDEVRRFNKENFKNYLEVFLDVKENIRKQRDSKGFFKNKTSDMAGVDQKIELPKNSDFVFKDEYDLESASAMILKRFTQIKRDS